MRSEKKKTQKRRKEERARNAGSKNKYKHIPGSWEGGSGDSGEGVMDPGCILKMGRMVVRFQEGMTETWDREILACEFEIGTVVKEKERTSVKADITLW